MRFKVDENIHPDVALLLRWAGHDSATVWDEGLRGKDDSRIAEVCLEEKRALVTLDLDFADIRRYPPDKFPGIVVMRLAQQSRQNVIRVFRKVLSLLPSEPLEGHLWIVEDASVRVRGGEHPAQEEP